MERMLNALDIESRFVDGRRETSPEAMEVVEMVLSGVVNKALAAGLTAAGVRAVGLSGRDGGLIRARLRAGAGPRGHARRASTRASSRALWARGWCPSSRRCRAGQRARR